MFFVQVFDILVALWEQFERLGVKHHLNKHEVSHDLLQHDRTAKVVYKVVLIRNTIS